MEQVEWALATRFQGDRDLVVIPQIQISTLDPSSLDGIGTKMGMDATAPVDSLRHAFKSIAIPGYKKIDLKEYL
jgi:2,5-furandicarboxylate decarboxylase 1